jgi:hypothetical protein
MATNSVRPPAGARPAAPAAPEAAVRPRPPPQPTSAAVPTASRHYARYDDRPRGNGYGSGRGSARSPSSAAATTTTSDNAATQQGESLAVRPRLPLPAGPAAAEAAPAATATATEAAPARGGVDRVMAVSHVQGRGRDCAPPRPLPRRCVGIDACPRAQATWLPWKRCVRSSARPPCWPWARSVSTVRPPTTPHAHAGTPS